MASQDIQYKSLKDLVQVQLDWITANAPVKLTTPLGPFLQAIAYSVGLVGLVLQRLIQLVLRAARLTTATEDDVDSFVADFGLTRNPAVAATGQVTFSKNVPTTVPVLIGLGVIVETSGGSPITFQTIADTSNLNFGQVAGVPGYILGANASSVTATVVAVVPGSIGNVGAGAITVIGSPLPGIDNVNNAQAFLNGQDIETDDALKARFALYLQSLGKATLAAIAFGVEDLNLGLVYQLYENIVVPSGAVQNGTVTIVVDDGSGATPAATLTAVQNAVELYRPAGVRPIVLAAQPVKIAVVGKVQYDSVLTADVTALQTVVENVVANYINAVPINGIIHYGRLTKVTIDATSPGDEVMTTIAPGIPASTNQVLQVLSTDGMTTGQLVQVGSLTTATGALPTLQSVDSTLQITLNLPLVSVPTPGTVVSSFSIQQDQVVDVENLNFGQIAGSTTTSNAASTSTVINVASSGTFTMTHLLIVAGFQTQTGALPTVALTGAGTITSSAPLGKINAAGVWTAVGSGGVVIPTSTPVFSFPASVADVTLGLQQIAKTNPNQIGYNFIPAP